MKITFEPESDEEKQHLKGGLVWQGVQDAVVFGLLSNGEDGLEPHQLVAVTDDMARAYMIALIQRTIMHLAEPMMATVVPAKRQRVVVPKLNGCGTIKFPGKGR